MNCILAVQSKEVVDSCADEKKKVESQSVEDADNALL